MARIFSRIRSISLFIVLFALFSFLFRQNSYALPDPHASAVLYSSDTRQNLREVILQAIYSAKKSITILIYAIQDPSIISALKMKAAEGVNVSVLFDPVASIDAPWHLGKEIHAIPVRSGHGLMHLKLISIDGEQAWIGSCNLTRDSLSLHGNLLAGILSPPLAEIIEQRAKEMQGVVPKNRAPFQIDAKDQHFELFFSPQQGKQALNKIDSLLKSARKTIKVASYTFTHPDLAQDLIDAKIRGVSVQVLFDKDSSVNTSKTIFQKLKKANVPIGVRKAQGLMHHKFAWIDDEILIMGSANWTKAAFTKNDEITCVISPLTEEQHETMKKTWDAMVENSTLQKKEV